MAKYTKFEQMSRVGSRDPPQLSPGLSARLVNGLPVRVLEKAGSGFDFTKTQLTGTVLGFLKMIKTQISLANN